MTKYVFDSETDALLRQCTRCWVIAAYNLTNNRMEYWEEGDLDWQKKFNDAELLVGHNILGFDIPMFKKLFNWVPNKKTKLRDTMIMSQVLNYKRFPEDSHSMEAWGISLGKPKQEHEDWTQYSPEMLSRCVTDVELNVEIYKILRNEFNQAIQKNNKVKQYMEVEHAVGKWCGQAELNGWPFDKQNAIKLFNQMELELNNTREKLLPLLGMKAIAVDKKNGIVEPKKPKYIKNGHYDRHLADWFGIDPILGLEEEIDREIVGEYCRVEFADLDLDSVSDVKIFLFRNGWKPTEWNWKTIEDPDTGERKKIKMAPKITEDSLEFLEANGKLYAEFLTTKSRYSLLKGWIENCDDNNRLHGTCFTIGTPSMRARHNIIVNVPSADSKWGPEIRSLFICPPGWKLIGCDSAGNQARGLAHYLKSEDFTNQLLHGDIHQYNADVLTAVLKEMGITHVVKRGIAKRILYAFLFGASGEKLWTYIFGSPEKKKGNKLKAGFTKAVPGFKNLLEKLENIYGSTSQTGNGYIPGIGGNRIYCDSFHKLLVYLLQAAEKATCGAAVMLTMERLEEAGIPYEPYIMMHDEEDFGVPEEYSEQAAAIGKQAFIDGPKLFGITIMDGDAKIGNNWYEVH